jgi:Flp pilus assembly protein TadD
MIDSSPRGLREAALDVLDARLVREPDAIDARFERACLLAELGRADEARDAYLELLARDPRHAGALNNLGTLLYAQGYRSAARTAYSQAAAQHPDDPMGHVNLANVLREAGELAAARMHYEAALRAAPDHPEAHQGLAHLLADEGDAASAAWHRQRGFRDRSAVTRIPYFGDGPPVELLLVVSAVGGNVPIQPLLDNRVFSTAIVVAEFYDQSAALPPHQLVFNAIGDADLCAPGLEAAAAILARTAAPIVNPPATVLATGRAANAERLGTLPGVRAPLTLRIPRERLGAPDAAVVLSRHGFALPLLLRAPGFHTGRYFLRVDSWDELRAAVGAIPGPDLFVIQYVDVRGPDDHVRKYRAMMIGGDIHPLHLAISDQWKVHYFTADMAGRPDHRAEEAAFLADITDVVGARGMAALGHIRDMLGLDYAGVDFALTAEGEVLVFEANATMVVNPPEPDPRWAYRREAVDRIHRAVRRMLIEKAGG